MQHDVATPGLMIAPPNDPEPLIEGYKCVEVSRSEMQDPDYLVINMTVEFGGRTYPFYVVVLVSEYKLARRFSFHRRPFEVSLLQGGGIELKSVQLRSNDTYRQQIFTRT